MPVDSVRVEVVLATPGCQRAVTLALPLGSSVRAAVERSRLLEDVPDAERARYQFGVYGEVLALDAAVEDGDRIEIYRPLLDDPKVIRRRRAAASRSRGRRRGGG